MAKIRPFRAFRYDLPRVGQASDLLAPPYDVVDDEGWSQLAARSPDNCIRVILPEGEGDARYPQGAAEFKRLIEKALVRDDDPGLYVYHQRFSVGGQTYVRKGFICLIELTRFGAGPVLPHERTLAGPKADRLALMTACRAHLELVFGLFSDSERKWEAAVATDLGTPVLEADFDGSHHTLYRVSDPKAVEGVTELLAERRVYMADGHHRYETMCTYREQLEAEGVGEAARYGMMYLSNLDDPGLLVLPTHRLIHDVKELDVARTVDGLRPFFEVSNEKLPDSAEAILERMKKAGRERAAFGLTVPGSGVLTILTLRADFSPETAGLGDLPDALQRLDVALLHELVLDRGFGITREAQAAKTNIHYYKSTSKALAVAQGKDVGDTQLVCWMNATPVADVVAVCDSGEVMPQKSTFFFPKIPTGLTFHAID